MSHRFTSWWRALSVVLLSLATLTWPTASWATATPQFDIVHQNALTSLSSLGTSTFTTVVSLTPEAATTTASVALFPALLTRSEITPIIDGTGVSGAPLSATGNFALDCVQHGEASFGVTLFTSQVKNATTSCGGIDPRLRLNCSGVSCGGVYPLRYILDVGGTKITKWSLLAIQSGPVARPLSVNLIATLTAADLSHAAEVRATLDALSHFSSLPFTLSVNYEALGGIELGSHTSSWRESLTRALASSEHQVVAAAPNDIDFAGLASSQLSTQVTQQFVLSSDLLTALTGRYTDDPIVVNGPQSSTGLLAIDKAGFNEVVLPEGDLSEAPSSTLTWGAPFHLTGAGNLTALSSDGPLSALATDSSIEPGRRAALTLATLAFLHYEAPYAPASRTVVIEAPLDELSKTYVNDLLGGLGHDAFSELAPLTPSFNPTLVGSDSAPTTRTLASSASEPAWSSHNVSSS